MMKLKKFILWGMVVSGCVAQAHAQVAQEPASPGWEAALNQIKAKAEILVAENRQLTTTHENLVTRRDQIKNAIILQAQKNTELDDFLQKRQGRTDQQIQLDGIKVQLGKRQQQLAALSKQTDEINQEILGFQRKINIKRLRLADWEIRKKTREDEAEMKRQQLSALVPTDEQIRDLRSDLEKQKAVEAGLDAKINELTRSASSQQLDTQALRKGNSELEARLAVLQKQADDVRQHPVVSALEQDQKQQLRSHKHDLEVKIQEYEARIEALKNPEQVSLSWDKQKKRMIHAMVKADAANQQVRSKIDNLKEDIDLLRLQIAKLERRVNFSQGKGALPAKPTR